jgi:predicted HTH domain antitoxin
MSGPASKESQNDLATIIGLYALGELSLGQAAQEADVSQQEFRKILSNTSIEARVGPNDLDDAQDEVDTALDV